MQKFEHASASQIRLYRRCPRKWYYNKIEGLPTPTSKAAELGKKIHAELENYLKFGIVPKSAIAKAGIDFLPDPNVELGLMVEEKIDLITDDLPVPIIGFADLIEDISGEIRITDHKTTSSFRNCKSPEELRTDPQAIIYGAFCFEQFDPPSGTLEFRHVYYNTKSPSSRQSFVRLTDREVAHGLQDLTETVKEMKRDSDCSTAEVRANPEACSDWGGCPFKSRCAKVGNGPGGAYEALIRSAKKQPKEEQVGKFSSMLKKRKEEQEAKQEQPAQEPQEQATEELQGINPPDGVDALEKTQIEEKKTTKRGGPFFKDGTRAKALKKDELLEKFSDDTSGSIFEKFTSDIQGLKTRKDIIEFMETNQNLFTGEEAPEPKPKPVEAKKDAPEPEPESEEVSAQSVVEAGEEEYTPETGKQTLHHTLYIGCHPRKKAVVYFEELVRPLQQLVADDAETFYYNAIPYAEGPKRVAALLFQGLKTGEIQMPENLVLDRRMPGADACLEILINAADSVVERIG